MTIETRRIFLFVALLLISIADVATTHLGVGVGAYEANPLFSGNIEAGYWARLALPYVLFWASFQLSERFMRAVVKVMIFAAIYGTIILLWNILVIAMEIGLV